MFKRFLPIICVLMFFVFHHSNLGYTHLFNDESEQSEDYNKIKQDIINIEKTLGPLQTKIVDSKLVIADLNSSWQANEAAIKANKDATITKALSAFIGAIAAIPTGGTSALAAFTTIGPAFISAVETYQSASKYE